MRPTSPGGDRADDPALLVGERLRAARRERGLTARQLAAASDLSFNTISLIERGKISPTVATLHKLAAALGVTLAFFFAETARRQVIFLRSGQRRQVRSARVLLEDLGSGLQDQAMEAMLLTLEPEADSGPDPIVHAGHELLFCLEGRVDYQVEGEVYTLEPEDSLLFEARLPHRWRNPLPTVSRALLIIQGGQGHEAVSPRHS